MGMRPYAVNGAQTKATCALQRPTGLQKRKAEAWPLSGKGFILYKVGSIRALRQTATDWWRLVTD
ncbi:hypothetical protein [Acetobacter syzygii]|uniref:hypothetical protein n=1 Tax=Acetobacter syzygii TaxID=146476 RepID=UPI0011780492|nr:hypothetical protein [Acetobacter syzygii]